LFGGIRIRSGGKCPAFFAVSCIRGMRRPVRRSALSIPQLADHTKLDYDLPLYIDTTDTRSTQPCMKVPAESSTSFAAGKDWTVAVDGT